MRVALSLGGLLVSTVPLASAGRGAAPDACGLLAPADIMKATGLTVENGSAGTPVPGVLSKCVWEGSGNTVRLVLTDAAHMQLTIRATQQEGTNVPGLGSQAFGMKEAALTGGYAVNVLDAKGGFGVSIIGKAGTPDRTIALAKVVESHR